MTAQQIKVAIADDHKIFRDGIRMALKDKEYLKILLEAEDGKDLMHKLKLKLPDVILMDIRMPEIDGINAISLIRKEYEALKIIVLTMYDGRNKLSGQVVDDVRAHLGEQVYKTVIPRNVRVSEAPSHSKPALLYDLKCAGSQAYLRLASEIIQRERALRAAER